MELLRSEAEPLLDQESEAQLSRQIEAGVLAREARLSGARPHGATERELLLLERLGEIAAQRYVRANLRLVSVVVRRATGFYGGFGAADLFQEGCLGLIQAVRKFDYQRGCKFSTFAMYWIRAYVNAACAGRLGELNLSTSRAARLRQLRTLQSDLAQTLGRLASAEEIGQLIGRNDVWTAELLNHQAPRSLDEIGLDALQIVDLGVDQQFEDVLTAERPGRELLEHLNNQQRAVLELRFGFADGAVHTYAEIGRRLRLPVAKVRRLERDGIEELRAHCPRQAVLLI